jgi:hypothetical protein
LASMHRRRLRRSHASAALATLTSSRIAEFRGASVSGFQPDRRLATNGLLYDPLRKLSNSDGAARVRCRCPGEEVDDGRRRCATRRPRRARDWRLQRDRPGDRVRRRPRRGRCRAHLSGERGRRARSGTRDPGARPARSRDPARRGGRLVHARPRSHCP